MPVGADKPYARVHNNRSAYFVRVGSTSREASRDELERMFQASGRLRYGVKPVPGATFDNLDQRRLRDYFVRVLDGDAPADEDVDEWRRLLANLDLAVAISGQNLATVDAMLLFGRDPKRFLPQSGVRAICYCGAERDYATRADEDVTGPLTPFCSPDGRMLEPGLVDLAWDFMRRNTVPTSYLDGPRRVDRWEFPEPVVREVLVNALAHRDYSIAGADILLEIFSDRLEIQSPGSLPNTVTLEGLRAGLRYARNQTLVNVLRDYRYVDARGMGVRNKVIPGMKAHNGTEPEFIEAQGRFAVRLWKESP